VVDLLPLRVTFKVRVKVRVKVKVRVEYLEYIENRGVCVLLMFTRLSYVTCRILKRLQCRVTVKD